MVMIVRLGGWADTERICPDDRAREGAIRSNPFGAGRNGALAASPSQADTPGISLALRLAIIPIAARPMARISDSGH